MNSNPIQFYFTTRLQLLDQLQIPRILERRILSKSEKFIIFVVVLLVVAAVIILVIPVINLPIIEIDLTLLENFLSKIMELDLQAVLPGRGKGEDLIIQIAGTLLLIILLLM